MGDSHGLVGVWIFQLLAQGMVCSQTHLTEPIAVLWCNGPAQQAADL